MNSTHKKFQWEELIIPTITIILAGYFMTFQILSGHRLHTVIYSGFICLVLIISSVTIIINKVKVPIAQIADDFKNASYLRMILMLGGVALNIYMMNIIGYLASFFIYIFIFLRIMGRRSYIQNSIIASVVVLFIHFLFVVCFDVRLPSGIWM